MGFALELENRMGSFYETKDTRIPEQVLADLAKGVKKRWKRLEKARREGVVEVVLESISGLDGDDYAVGSLAEEGEGASLRQAIALEETCSRFYMDAALKLPIREISRLFRRLAEGNDENAERLQALLVEGSDP
jgi:rubrerythrin